MNAKLEKNIRKTALKIAALSESSGTKITERGLVRGDSVVNRKWAATTFVNAKDSLRGIIRALKKEHRNQQT